MPARDCCHLQLNGRLCLVVRAVLASPLQGRPSGRLKQILKEQSFSLNRRRTNDSGRRDHVQSQVCSVAPIVIHQNKSPDAYACKHG